MEAYISDSATLGRNGPEMAAMYELIPQYKAECQDIQSSLVKHIMRGYEAGW